MSLPGQTGRQRHYVLDLSVHPTIRRSVTKLPDTVVSASTLRSFQHQLKTFFISTILYLLAL